MLLPSQSQFQQFPVLVERSANPSVVVQGYGRNKEEAADRIRCHARDYGYYDAVCVSPSEDSAPDRGTGR